MLIIGRKTNQEIIIADNIEITILEIGRNRVRFGIEAPTDVSVHTRLQNLPAEPTDAKSRSNQAMAAGRSRS